MPTWQDQWRRVERYYKRFREMNDCFKAHGEPSDYYFDDMLSFFKTACIFVTGLKQMDFHQLKFSNLLTITLVTILHWQFVLT